MSVCEMQGDGDPVLNSDGARTRKHYRDLVNERRREGKLQEAESVVREAILAYPADLSFQADLADIMYRRDRLEEAQAVADEVLRLDPAHYQALMVDGNVYFKRRQYERAREYFVAADAISHTSYSAGRLAEAELRLGMYREAMDRSLQALERHPNDGWLVSLVARAYEKLGDVDKAIEWYEKARELNPKNSFVYTQYVKLKGRRKEPATYAKELDGIMKVRERAHDPNLLVLKGDVLQRAGDLSGSIGCYEEAARLAPEDAFVVSKLGFACHRAGDDEKAIPLLEEVLSRDPGNMHARSALAAAYRKLGRYAQGAGFFERLAQDHPSMKAFWGEARKLRSKMVPAEEEES